MVPAPADPQARGDHCHRDCPSPRPPTRSPRMTEGSRLLDTVQNLLADGRTDRLSELLDGAHPVDLSHVLRELGLTDQVALFRRLKPAHAGAVLSELDD